MTGAISRQTWLGIVGFVIMLASATVGLGAWRGRQAAAEGNAAETRFEAPDSPAGLSVIQGGRSGRKPRRTPGRSPKSAKQGFMQRIEERWQRRRDQNGF
jgi:hypothetical protein